MIRLVVSFGDGQQRFNVPINAKRTLGSAGDNDFVVAWPGISKHHATVERVGEWILINDSGSKNGIVMAGERRDRVHLRPGDTARIGRASLHVEEISTSDADVAVAFDHQSSSQGPEEGGTDTEGDVERGVTAALRWVREAAAAQAPTPDQRRALLESAAAIVGADALLICPANGELSFGELIGGLPPEGEIDALVSRTTREDSRWFFVPVTDGMVLAAHALTPRFSAWQREFLEHVGSTLFTQEEVRARSLPSTSAGEVLYPNSMVVGSSAAMRDVRDRVRMAVQSGLNVLLRGESGTGKELIARTIHDSSRVSGPFRPINCAAIPNELFEAEMFGIRSGVATGVERRSGHFIEAEGGTLFLDEIGDLSPAVQAKLLRVLQEREVLPLGAPKAVRVNVRIVASTNRDLEALVRANTYRLDLYYRLRGIEIVVPPLRNRVEDIPALAVAFASRSARRASKRIRGISRKALSTLTAQRWPGNIRELEHVIEQAIVRCHDGGTIETSHLDLVRELDQTPDTLQSRREYVEHSTINEALKRANGNKTEAASILGISRQALHKKLRRDPGRK